VNKIFQRYIDMVRQQPDNPEVIYILCKYLRPKSVSELADIVGVPLKARVVQQAWDEYRAVKERGQLA
jgi:hypothetical protein